ADKLGLSADQVSQYTNQAMGILEGIFELDPTAAAEEWYQKQMGTLQEASMKALKALGQHATDAVDTLIKSLKPFTDWFSGLPINLQSAIDKLSGPGGAFPGFADAINVLIARLNGTLPGGPTTGGRAPGSGRQNGPPGEDAVTSVLYG